MPPDPHSPKALLIHGAGGGAWEWVLWRRAFLARGRAVEALELQPGPAGLAATTLADYQAQVEAARARSGARVLVGASLGGLLALRVAAPETTDAVVLVNPVPPAGLPGWPPSRRRHPAVIRWERGTLESTRRALPDADPATVHWAHARWRDESGAVLDALDAGVPAALPPLPVLVIAGGEDRDVPPQLSRALAARLGAPCVMAPGVSHVGALLGMRAAGLAQLVCDWLAAQGL